MPLYEYRCESCGHILEILQKISDPKPETCEKCGNGPMHKLMSKTSFVLKGSGWYVTDFKDGKKKQQDANGEKGESKADSPSPKSDAGDSGTSKDNSGSKEKKPSQTKPSS